MTTIIDGSGSADFHTALPVAEGGTGVTASTGSGNVVLSASPTLTGTIGAAALTLTTPLPVASGGTGVTSSTGSGNAVLSVSPTLTGTVTTGTANVGYLNVLAQNADAEGGEISLKGAASHPAVQLDNYAGNVRVHTLASGKAFQVLGGTGVTAVAHNTWSDYRLKENVEYKWDATSRLKQLKPARFNFIGEDNTVDGFMAHEAQEVVPESVTGFKDEVDDDDKPVMQGIDQAKLVPLLVKTIQELEARIAKLEGTK